MRITRSLAASATTATICSNSTRAAKVLVGEGDGAFPGVDLGQGVPGSRRLFHRVKRNEGKPARSVALRNHFQPIDLAKLLELPH
jgi:hypothetical protein